MILFAIPIILLLYFTFTQFVSIAGTFFGSLHQAATGNSTVNMSQLNSSIQNLALPGTISQGLAETIKTGITQFISYAASSVITLISSIPLVATQLPILIFSVFYFAKDGDKVVQYVKDVIPDNDKKFYLEIFNSADDVLKNIIVGNVIPAVILGILSGFLYFFLGYPYVILLAIISGVAMFIPIIGPWIVYGAIGIFSILIGIHSKVLW